MPKTRERTLCRPAELWLRAERPDEDPSDDGPDWDTWLLRRMNAGAIVTLHGVFVDRAVLEQRFACVPERCAPRAGRGAWRSCCADVQVPLTLAEERRLTRHRKTLTEYLGERAGPASSKRGSAPSKSWFAGGELEKVDRRCTFARLTRDGKLRCRLRGFAQQKRIAQSDVQPLPCRLFPLLLVDTGDRVLLTVVSSSTYRLVSAFPPRRYPCLADPSLPPLWESMRADLDWLFGRGFARALKRAAT